MKERKLEEVKIKIIREINKDPEYKSLSMLERKNIIDKRISNARKNKEIKKEDSQAKNQESKQYCFWVKKDYPINR